MDKTKTLNTGLILTLDNNAVGRTSNGGRAILFSVANAWLVEEVNGWDVHTDGGSILGPFASDGEASRAALAWEGGRF